MKFPISKLILAFSFLTLFVFVAFAADSYRVNNSATVRVTEHGDDLNVINACGNDKFVPTKASTEWTNFKNNKPVCVTTADPCTGTRAGGYCFFLGANGQSCDTVCTGKGSCNLTGTRDYAGSGGTNANCTSIANTLNSGAAFQGGIALNIGCFVNTTTDQSARGTTATTCAASNASYARVCACDTTINPNTPNAFAFTNVTNQTTSTLTSSNAVTLTGFTGPLTATCSGCTAIARNGAWSGTTSLAGFMPGDTIAIRRNSSSLSSTAVTATVTIALTTSSPWSITTAGPSCAGTMIGSYCWYVGTNGQSCDTVCASNGGCNLAGTRDYAGSNGSDANCTAVAQALTTGNTWNRTDNQLLGCYIISAGRIRRGTDPTTCDETDAGAKRLCACDPTVGPADSVPEPIVFANQSYVPTSTLIESDAVTLSGFNTTLTATCTNCTDIARNGTWAGATTLAGFVVGDTIQIRRTSSASLSTAVTASVTVGTVTSSTWTVTTEGTDVTPTAFNFTNQTGVNVSTTITSNSVTLAGFNKAVTATCTNCTSIARNGSWGGTSVSGFIPGDQIRIRRTSSPSYSTAVTATATVGSTTSGTWSITTKANTPDPFSFTDQTNVATSTLITSSTETLSGFTGTFTATCTGCTAIARNGVWGGTSVAGFVAGNTIAIRRNSSASNSTTVTATATVGSTTSGTWSITTVAGADSAPNAFSFTNQTNVAISSTITSNAVTLNGFTGPLVATCSSCSAIARNGTWGGTSVSGFMPGDTITLRKTSSGSYSTAVTTTATVGTTTSSAWSITTQAAPACTCAATTIHTHNLACGTEGQTRGFTHNPSCTVNEFQCEPGLHQFQCTSGTWVETMDEVGLCSSGGSCM